MRHLRRRGGDGARRPGVVARHARRRRRRGWSRRSSCRARPKCSEFPSLLNERALLQSIAATLKRVLIGFGLAILVGVPLGIVAGSWRVLEAAGAPLALFGRNLPVAALIPLTILWFGIDETQKVMFIFIACVPFVYSDAVRAIASVPDRYVETAQTLGASRVADRDEGAGRARAARHLQQPAAPVRLAFGYIMLAELINASTAWAIC